MKKTKAKALGIILALMLYSLYLPLIRNINSIPSELQIFEGDAHILIWTAVLVKIEGIMWTPEI